MAIGSVVQRGTYAQEEEGCHPNSKTDITKPDIDELWENIPSIEYFRSVFANMMPGYLVNFGNTGNGIRPNYQTKNDNGKITVYVVHTGNKHQQKMDLHQYSEKRLFEPYTYKEIQSYLERREPRGGKK